MSENKSINMNSKNNKESESMSERFAGWCDRWVPDAMVFVMLLTVIAVIAALIIPKAPLLTSTDTQKSIVDAWITGFWSLLQFAMQMALIMVTGFVVANSRPVKRVITKIAAIPKSQTSAILLVALVCFVIWWVHWGFGMMAGILLGREILAQAKRQGYKIHRNAFIGVTYAITCSSGGISVAAPLFAATPGFLRTLVPPESAALLPEAITLNQTVLMPTVLLQVLALGAITLFIVLSMAPKEDSKKEEISHDFMNSIFESGKEKSIDVSTPAEKINNSPILNILIGSMGMYWCVKFLAQKGIIGLSINDYNFIMLMLGVLLNWTPARFADSVKQACEAIWGVVIQFPFYAGIFGIIAYTGLNHSIVDAFVAISTPNTFPWITYIYSAILNFFVPSGGSKFIIEAPYIIPAAQAIGANIPSVLNAYTFGDLSTNLIQPFWALPILAMYRVKFKDILPYGFVVCIASIILNSFWMLIFY